MADDSAVAAELLALGSATLGESGAARMAPRIKPAWHRARLAARQGCQRLRRDADRGVAIAGVEDVGAVSRGGHPGGDDRVRGGQPQRAPGDVLADFIAQPCSCEVAAAAQAAGGGVAARPDVIEVVGRSHVVAVRLCGTGHVRVGAQRALSLAGAFTVDQAQRGGANAVEVRRCGHEVGIDARAAVGRGWPVPGAPPDAPAPAASAPVLAARAAPHERRS